MKGLFKHLQSRGLVQDSAHPDELAKLLDSPPVSFYCGFDPTSDSLHVGNMAALALMRMLQRAGHKPIVLLGSATGMIGDPSGKSEERKLLDSDQIEHNLRGIEKPISHFLESGGPNGYEIVKNHEWMNKISYVDFLRDVGKHFSVNMMLSKDSVKARLENREQGISYTEFSYMLLQAYDFLWLNQNKKCRLQIGGSDQWGNITAGMELIRKKTPQSGEAAYGFTYPLITTKAGNKFGKTEKGAVWLDAAKTSPYSFYQFWLNSEDDEVLRWFKVFTDLSAEELAEIEQGIKSKPEERAAQKRLAQLLTTIMHGESEAKRAEQAGAVLFGGSLAQIDKKTLLEIFGDVPSTQIPRADLEPGIQIQELLTRATLAKSKGEAKRLIEGGGIYLNNERVSDVSCLVNSNNLLHGSIIVIRSGRKNYHLVQVQS